MKKLSARQEKIARAKELTKTYKPNKNLPISKLMEIGCVLMPVKACGTFGNTAKFSACAIGAVNFAASNSSCQVATSNIAKKRRNAEIAFEKETGVSIFAANDTYHMAREDIAGILASIGH